MSSCFIRWIKLLFATNDDQIINKEVEETHIVETLELSLIRNRGTKGFTEGRMCVDGVFMYHTLEDQEREVEGEDVLEWKIPTITAIPRGRYEINFHQSPRFKRLLPILLDVDGFSYVLIHSGNNASNTEGCILVGMRNKNLKDGWISNSRDAERDLMVHLNKAHDDNKRIFITVV